MFRFSTMRGASKSCENYGNPLLWEFVVVGLEFRTWEAEAADISLILCSMAMHRKV